MFPISFVMIAKDEEDVIGECLQSIVPIVNQIVVIDTGSTDHTIEIANQFGAEVHRFNWQDDFSLARNYATGFANNPWILTLDADERLELWDSKSLTNMLSMQTVWSLRSVHEFYRDNQLLEQIVYQPRLFPNSLHYRYYGRIHEELRYRGQAIQTRQTEMTFRHIGYHKERVIKKDKINRNVSLHLIEHKNDPTQLHHLYRAAKTCYHAYEYQLAKELLENLMQHDIPDVDMYHSILIDYGYICKGLKVPSAALQLIVTNAEIVKESPDIWFILGILFLCMETIDDLFRAKECFETCLKIGEKSKFGNHTPGTGSFLAHYQLGLIFEVLQDSRSVTCFRNAAEYGYSEAIKKLNRDREI